MILKMGKMNQKFRILPMESTLWAPHSILDMTPRTFVLFPVETEHTL